MRRKLRCMSAEACQRQPGVDVKRSLQDRSAYVAIRRIEALEGPPPEEPESKAYLPLLCEYEIALTAREVRGRRHVDRGR